MRSPISHLVVPAAKRTIGSARLLLVLALAAGGLAGAHVPASALASGDVNEASCPNESMTGFSANLPDCRAYEQVSPTEKDNGSGGVYFFNSEVQASERLPMQSLADGSAITYPGEPFFNIEPRNPALEGLELQYTSERATNGWSTHVHDTLEPEAVPTPPLPPLTVTNGHEVTQSQVLEETQDGSKVFFLDERELIPGDSNAAPNEPDLYEYTIPSPTLPNGHLEDLTVDTNIGPHGEHEHADVQGIVGIGGEGSEEGGYVYFVAGGILASGASSGGCTVGTSDEAVGLGCNLYLRHDGVTTFIDTLPASDEQGDATSEESLETRDWVSSPSLRTAEVSPSGQYLVFGSRMTGLDGGSTEIFRYDAEAAKNHEPSTLCLSCSPTGGRALLPPSHNTQINGANRQRYVLDNGRVLFTTTQQLVPQDANHQPDVYEWENGAARLISAGTSETGPSIFADASASGSDIFFTTSQSLVPSDQDEITDVYDAREDGGWPPAPAPACPHGSSCPAGTSSLVSEPLPATFNTPGTPFVAETVGSTPNRKPPVLSKAQRLSKALSACRKADARSRHARLSCEKQARAKYAPQKKSKSKQNGSK